MLAGGPIIFKSRLQSTTAHSTAEAEYTALYHVTREVICFGAEGLEKWENDDRNLAPEQISSAVHAKVYAANDRRCQVDGRDEAFREPARIPHSHGGFSGTFRNPPETRTATLAWTGL